LTNNLDLRKTIQYYKSNPNKARNKMDEKEEHTEDNVTFDFQDFSIGDLDGPSAWSSGSYDEGNINIDPTWFD